MQKKKFEFPYHYLLSHPGAELWYDVLPTERARLLDLKEGDYVVILARIATVQRSGGYERGATPPPGTNRLPEIVKEFEEPKLSIQLDPNEIFLGRKDRW